MKIDEQARKYKGKMVQNAVAVLKIDVKIKYGRLKKG